MISNRLRTLLQFGVMVLVLLAPLPYGSVQAGPVLAIKVTAAVLGLGTILLIGRDPEAAAAVPRLPLAICFGLIALGIFQILPLPFAIAAKFNPTADLVRPLIPYLGLDRPPSVCWSIATPETTDALIRLLAYVLIGLTSAVAFNTERSRRGFAFVLVAAAVFQAVYGSGEYLTGRQHIFGFAKIHYRDSATGTFINRNHFATMLAIAFPFSLALALPNQGQRGPRHRTWRESLVAAGDGSGLGRLLAVSASVAIWMGLLLSHSRGGLLVALVAVGIVLFRFRELRVARWAGAIGAGVLLVLLSANLTQAPGERFFTIKGDLQSRGGRLTVWRDSLDLVATRPTIGWGFGTFESAFPTVQSEGIDLLYDHAHNDWLEWTTEGGLVTLAAALVLFILSVRGRFDPVIAVASRAAIVAVALHACWDFSLRIPAVALIVSAIVGVVLGGYAVNTSARAAGWQRLGAIRAE